MYKLLFGLAVAALGIAISDLQAPLGSRAATEGGILLILAAAFAVAGAVAWARGTKKCSACAERIKRAATKCKHCGASVS